MYSPFDFGRMLRHPRVDAYTSALARAIRPGAVVLDIGTGTGFFAMVAARLGAKRVYAVEPIAAAARLAGETVRANGLADTITVIEGRSTEIDLPERADVVVADLRGRLPFFAGNPASLADARARHLAPGGTLLPLRDTVHVAAFSSPALRHNLLGGYERDDFDFSACRRAVTHSMLNDDGAPLAPEHLVTAPAPLLDLVYGEAPPRYVGKARLEVTRAAPLHGLALWFDAQIDEIASFSNAPGSPLDVYGRVVLPWDPPLDVPPGTILEVEALARPTRDDFAWSFVTSLGPHQIRQSPLRL